MTTRSIAALLLLLLLAPFAAFAGGPLIVGGPSYGRDGEPFTWDAAKMPIQYRVDPGPMATFGAAAVISNTTGLSRLQSMFGVWHAVPTAAVSFNYAGPILTSGSYVSGTDVRTAAQFNDIAKSCKDGQQSPIIFDADGSLFASLGLPPEVIGFAGPCAVDSATGHITTASAMLNGKMQDGVGKYVNGVPNYELTANEFNQAITHEFGHLLGLDHSQINVDVLQSNQYPCDPDTVAGLPLMFPEFVCQARVDAGLPPLAPDDISAISTLYPSASFSTSYGTISGRIYFSDGISQVEGANIVVRAVDDPFTAEDESRRVAISTVSGYLFTANPGQSVTADMSDPKEDNTGGAKTGSRDATLIGYYRIAVPPGDYTVEVESVDGSFTAGSSVGPLDPPSALPASSEFWNKDESAFDFPLQQDRLSVPPGGNLTGIDIILNSTPPRFDRFEGPGAFVGNFPRPPNPLLWEAAL